MRTLVLGALALALPLSVALPALAAGSSVPVAPATCIDLPANLGQGARDAAAGGQVADLQAYLKSAGFLSSTTPAGFFGPLTRAAVVKFQAQAGVPQTGLVGALTRAALTDRSCPDGFSFIGVNVPRALAVGEKGTWVVGITLPSHAASPLISTANWDDAASTTTNGATVALHARTAYLAFTHAYAAAGTSTPVFTIQFSSEPPLIVRAQADVR